MSKTSHQVLEILSSGESFSGEFIGRQLGVSRMAISKGIKSLTDLGLEITSVPGKGYQLAQPIQLLDIKAICSKLYKGDHASCYIEIVHEVDSTSDYLLEQSKVKDINRHVCIAESQNSGRGRRQRGGTPALTVMLFFQWDGVLMMVCQVSPGLGIAAGITIARTLHEAGFDNEHRSQVAE